MRYSKLLLCFHIASEKEFEKNFSFFFQQYPACLVRLTWIVFVMGASSRSLNAKNSKLKLRCTSI